MKILKLLAPHLLAVVVFIVVTFLYFPPLLEGKAIRQGDIMQFLGMSKEIVDFREKTGKEALWTNSMFGGMPAYQISVVYKNNVAKKINNVISLKFPVPAVYLFLSLVGFYILMLVLGANIWIAVAGAFAFAFSSYFFIIEAAGHNSKAHAMAFMAPILAGVILSFRGRYILGATLFALFLALQIYANHLQITYYTAIIILVFGLVELIYAYNEKRLAQFFKATGLLAAVALVAASTNFTGMYLTYEYGKDSTRGKSELTTDTENKTSGLDKNYILNDYSYGITETFNLFIPNFTGGGSEDVGENSESFKWLQQNNYNAAQAVKSMPTYFGDQRFTAGPVYIGAVVIFLFVLGLFLIRGAFKWWVVSATLLSILLAWGKNMEWLSSLFINFFPGYNKFRTVSMILVIAEFTIPVFAMLTFIKIVKKEFEIKKLMNSLLYSIYITGGFAFVFILIPGLLTDFSGPADERMDPSLVSALTSDRAMLLRSDAFRSLIFVLLTAGLVWMFVKDKIKAQWATIILALLFLLDLGFVGKRYLNSDNFVTKREARNPYIPSSADQAILQDTSYYRVMNLTVDPFNDASTSYFHKSIGGYHGAKLKRYQELIDHHISKMNIQVLNMLNTKYFIGAGQDQQPMPQINPDALGNAWFVDSVMIVDNADQEIAALSKLTPKTKAVVDKRFENLITKNLFPKDTLSSILLTHYEPNYLTYDINAGSEKLAVFSEIYYAKGWNAYLDGKLTPHFRANYVLRAMQIPAGKHKLEFKFEPQAYVTGEKISMAGSILLVILLIAGFGFELFRFVKKENSLMA